MTVNETPEVTNITSLPTPKQKKLRNPFAKNSESAPTDAEETNTPKVKAPHGVYKVGLLLLAGGAVAALASKVRKSGDDETIDDSSDIPTTDN